MQLTPQQKRKLNNLMNKGYSYTIAFKEVIGNTVTTSEKVARKFVDGQQNKSTYNYPEKGKWNY